MRETRHLWVGNLPDNAREEKIVEFFKRYGRIEKAKILSKRGSDGDLQAVVAFVDLRAAEKAHNAVNTIGDKQLQTNYSEPAAMSTSGRPDSSPSSNIRHGQSIHRGHSSHRTDSKTAEGHIGERSHSDRRRSHQGSSDSSRNPELSDSKSSQKGAKDLAVEGGSKKTERKQKIDSKTKKKQKKTEDNVTPKSTKHKTSRGRSPTIKKKSTNRKQRRPGSSSEEERTTSSSYSSGTTGRSTSSSSGSTSASSSRSNSLNSSSPLSTAAESDSEGGQKLVTMIIKKLPARPSVTNLREGIYHEFKKCGKVKSVVIRGDNNNRHALVLFRNSSEANKSVNHAKSKLLFGAAIEAAIYEGEVSGKELQKCGGIIDEFHPRASRTLFVGNLDKTVGYSDIQNIFVRFGEIVAIEIKRQNNVPQYAFLQYTDIASVVKAIQKMDGEKLGKNTLKLGFGKTVISSCVWVSGVTESFTEHYLASCFQKHGQVEYVVIDRNRGQALVFYCKFEHAQQALSSLRGRKMNGSRLKLDYASHKLIELFLSDMQNSGQTATTFDSIRHLILSAPTTPSAPTPATSTSRSSSRPSSGHPYIGAPDSYYDRYPHAPPTYDPSAPSRSDWRSREDWNRGRPPYHSVSPRGRRAFDEDRPERSELYHRDDECFSERVPNYEPEYSEYRREHGRDYPAAPLPRGYADDYHRGMKPRDRRDPLYHSRHSPSRIIRRSRSNSPRPGIQRNRGRIRDFDPKLEPRMHEHRDMPPRGRSPVRSPGSREDRGSGSDTYSRKFRDHRYGSPTHYYNSPPKRGPSPYGRRTDERRVELREGRSLPGSPRSGGVRSKVVQDTSSTQWPTPSSRSSSKPSDSGETWPAERTDYDRRSETPTRDENLDSIGEIIIKQPAVSSVITRTIKQEIGRQKSIDATSTKTDFSNKSSSRASSTHSDREVESKQKVKLESVVSERPSSSSRSALLQRVHSQSPPVDAGSSKSTRQPHKEKGKKSQHEEKRKGKTSHRDNVQISGSDSESSRKDQKQKQKTGKESSKRRRDSRVAGPNLIKREYSPTGDRAGLRPKDSAQAKEEVDKVENERKHRKDDKYSDERSTSDRDRSSSTSKKRRHSEAYCSDNEDRNSPKDRERHSPVDRHHTAHPREDDEHAKPIKRVRKSSTKHEAPMSIASQSFMDEVADEEVVDSGPESREPPAHFRPRLTVKEEVVEVMPEMEVVETEVIEHSELPETCTEVMEDEIDHELVAEPTPEVEKAPESAPVADPVTASNLTAGKVVMAQPFVSSYNPYSSTISSAVALMPVQISKRKPSTDDTSNKGGGGDTVEGKEPASNLTQLEKEKMHLQQLLSKLDSEQRLGLEEASEVADIYITGIAQKIKSRVKKETKPTSDKTPKDEEESSNTKVETEQVNPETESAAKQEPSNPVEFPTEQTIIEEVVADEVVTEVIEDEVEVEMIPEVAETIPAVVEQEKPVEDVDLTKSFRKQMEAKRLKEQKRREKEQKSLLKKQRKERERQKEFVEKMRPKKLVISAVDVEEEEEEVVLTKSSSAQNTPMSTASPSVEKTCDKKVNPKETSIEIEEVVRDESSEMIDSSVPDKVDTDAKMSLSEQDTSEVPPEKTPDDVISEQSRSSNPDVVSNKKEDQNSPCASSKPMVPPSSGDATKPLPVVAKPSGNTPLMAPPTNKTPVTASPYTPKSASSQGKSSHTSQKSSSSNTNTPSPSQAKRKPPQAHHHADIHGHVRRSSSSGHRPDKHAQRHHSSSKYHPSDPKRRKVEHRPKHHEQERKRTTFSPPKAVTNLTVALNVSPSEPLGKKELEILKSELESMRNQLSFDMSPGFLSPSSEDDSEISPMSPILKSPTSERFTGIVDPSSEGKNLMVSPSQNRAHRLKQLGKVKKKVPLEDLTVVTVKEEEKIKEMKRKLEDQRQLEFRHMRLFRSNIFEQDFARLSHLKQGNEQTAQEAAPRPVHNATLFTGLVDMELDNKPLFSSFVEKLIPTDPTSNLKTRPASDDRSQVPKNVVPLSSDISIPAPVESVCVIAGETTLDGAAAPTDMKVDMAEPEPDSVKAEKVDLAESRVAEKIKESEEFDSRTNQDTEVPAVEASQEVNVGSVVLKKTGKNLSESAVEEQATKSTKLPDTQPVVEELQSEMEIGPSQEEIPLYSEDVPSDLQDVVTVSGVEIGADTEIAAPESVDNTPITLHSPIHTAIITGESHLVEESVTASKEEEKEQPSIEVMDQTVDVVQETFVGGIVEEAVVSEVLPDVDDDYGDSSLVIDAGDDVETPKLIVEEETEDSIPALVEESVAATAPDVTNVELESSHEAPDTITKGADVTPVQPSLVSEPKKLPEASVQVKKEHKSSSSVHDHKEKRNSPAPVKKEKSHGQTSGSKHSSKSGTSKDDVKVKKKKVEKSEEKRPTATEKMESKEKKVKKLHKKIFKESTSTSSSPRPSHAPETAEKISKPADAAEKKSEKIKKEKSLQKSEKKHVSDKSKSERVAFKDRDAPKSHKQEMKKERKDNEKLAGNPKVQKSHGDMKHQKSTSQERASSDSKASKMASQDKSGASSTELKSHKSSSSHKSSDSKQTKHSSDASSKSEKSASGGKPLHKSSGDKKLKLKHAEDKKKPPKPSKEGSSEAKSSKTDESKSSHKSKPHSAERHSDTAKSALKKDKHKHDVKKEATSSPFREKEEKKKHSIKVKSQKQSTVTDQPVKKKPRLEEVTKPSSKLSKTSFFDLSDSDGAMSSPAKKPEPSHSSHTKHSKHWSSDSDSDEEIATTRKPAKIEVPETKKSKVSKLPEAKPKHPYISSDSDSSDNYDSFISAINNSSGRKPKWEERSDIYSASDEESDEGDVKLPEKPVKPVAVQKISKSERQADSDHSDKSSHHKQSPMTQKDSPSVRHHDQSRDKSKEKHKVVSEKTSKSSIKSDKKNKLEKKIKKVSKKPPPEQEDEKTVKHSKEKVKTPRAVDSDDVEEKPKHTKQKVKDSSFSPSQQKSKTLEEKKHAPVAYKLSSSSSSGDSLEYPPPSPPSSFLTTKTIKSETSYNPDYSDQFSATSSQKKDQPGTGVTSSAPKSKFDSSRIYSSSSSDMDSDYYLEPKISSSRVHNLSKEERRNLLGTDSSETEEEFERIKGAPVVQEIEEKVDIKPKHHASETVSGKHSEQDAVKQKKKLSSKSSSLDHKPSSKKQHDQKSKPSSEKAVSKYSDVKSEKKKEKSKVDVEIKKETGDKPKHSKATEHHKKHKHPSKVVDERPTSKHEEKSRESSKKPSTKPHTKHEKSIKTEKLDSSKSHESHTKPEKPLKPDKPDSMRSIKTEKPDSSKSHESHTKRHEGVSKTSKHVGEKAKRKGEHHKLKPKSSKSHDSVTSDEKRLTFKDEHGHKSSSKPTSELQSQDKLHSKDKKSHSKLTEQKLKKHGDGKHQEAAIEKVKVEKKQISSDKTQHPEPTKQQFLEETPEVKNREEEVESDSSMPGSSFFESSDIENRAKLQQADTPNLPYVQDKTTDSREKSFSPKTHSSPLQTPTQSKSIFSPSQSFEVEDRFSDQEAKSSSSGTNDGKHETRGSTSRKSSTSSTKSREARKDSSDRNRSKSRELSPSESRKLAMSALERCQMQHERKRKDLERMKNLSRQRDEEAVRSIMGEDDNEDIVSSSSDADYRPARVTKSFSDNEPSTEVPYYQQPVVPKEETQSLPGDLTPEASISTEKSDSDLGKSSDIEPRSKAEENELAAAISSIEGFFDDFNKNKQDDDMGSSYPPYEETTKPETPKTVMPPEPYEDSGSLEAATAASALLSATTYPAQDSLSTYKPTVSPKKYDPTPPPVEQISLPSRRSPETSFVERPPPSRAASRSRSNERTAETVPSIEPRPSYEERESPLRAPSPESKTITRKQIPVQQPSSRKPKPLITSPVTTPNYDASQLAQTPERPGALTTEKCQPAAQSVPENRPFVPLSTSKPIQPEPTVKETKHSPQIGVHAELPQALPLPTHRPAKDGLTVATPERKPAGFGHVHAIASMKQPVGAVGAKTNIPSPFVVHPHSAGPRGEPCAPYGLPGPQISPQKHVSNPSQHAPFAYPKSSPQASPTFKFPSTSHVTPLGVVQSPQHHPQGAAHVISPTTFVSPQPSNKAFATSHQHAAFTLHQANPTPEPTPPPIPTPSPTAVPQSHHSPVMHGRPPPVSPNQVSPKLPTNLPSPTVRHSQPMHPLQAKPEPFPSPHQNVQVPGSTPTSIYSPPAASRHHMRTPTSAPTAPAAPTAPVHKPPETPPEPIRQAPPQTIHTSQPSPRPTGSQSLPYPPPPASAQQYMMPFQGLPGQSQRLPPHCVGVEPPSAASTAAPGKVEAKHGQQMQIPGHYLYQPGAGFVYPNFPIGPGVSFPRSFGLLPGMSLPIGFPPQPSRPQSTGEPPRHFAQTHSHLGQPQPPVTQPAHTEKSVPQTPVNKGRATPGTPKPPTPRSPHVLSTPPAQTVPPQQIPYSAGRTQDPRPAAPEPSPRAASGSQQDASAMVAKHFLLSGFPSSPHRHQAASAFPPRPGIPGFTPQVYRPEMGTPPFSHHLPAHQPTTSQPRMATSGHFYPPPDQHLVSASALPPAWKQEKHEPSRPTKQPTDHPAMYHSTVLMRNAPEAPHQHQQQPRLHQLAHHSQQQPPRHHEPTHQTPPPSQQPHSQAPRLHVQPQPTVYHPPTQPYQPRYQLQPTEKPQPQQSPYQPPHTTPPPLNQVARRAPSPAPKQGEEAQTSLENIFSRYPVIWQGKVALKTEFAAVHLHFVCGNVDLAETGLPKTVEDKSGLYVLRIVRRMRLYPAQLESLHSRMGSEKDFCMLLALPCGRDNEDIVRQTSQLGTSFIKYMKDREVASIAESRTATGQELILHIFPPCHFTNGHLQRRAPDLLSSVGDIEHLLIVIAPSA